MYLLELDQPLLFTAVQSIIGVFCPWVKPYMPEWCLPQTVVLKQQKLNWEPEFAQEKAVYKLFETSTRCHYSSFIWRENIWRTPGTCFFSDFRKDVWDLARSESPVNEDDLRDSLKNVMKTLTQYGVEYGDQNLANFLLMDQSNNDKPHVVIIDFEQANLGVWEQNLNSGTAESLMLEFSRIRKAASTARRRYGHLPRYY